MQPSKGPRQGPSACRQVGDTDKQSSARDPLAELRRHVTQVDVFPSVFQFTHSCETMDRIVQSGDAQRFVKKLRTYVACVDNVRAHERPWTWMVQNSIVDVRITAVNTLNSVPAPCLVTRTDADLARWTTALLVELDRRWANPPKTGFFMRKDECVFGIQRLSANIMAHCPLTCDVVFFPGPNHRLDMDTELEMEWQYIVGFVVHERDLRVARSIVVNSLAIMSTMSQRTGGCAEVVTFPAVSDDDRSMPACHLTDAALAQLSCYSVDVIAKHAMNGIPSKVEYRYHPREHEDDAPLMAAAWEERYKDMPSPRMAGRDIMVGWREAMCTPRTAPAMLKPEDLDGLSGMDLIRLRDGVKSKEMMSDRGGEYMSFNGAVRGTRNTVEYRCLLRDNENPDVDVYQHVVVPQGLMEQKEHEEDQKEELKSEWTRKVHGAHQPGTPLEIVKMDDGTYMSKEEYTKRFPDEALTFRAEIDESGIHPSSPSLVDIFSTTRHAPECVQKLSRSDAGMAKALIKIQEWTRQAPALAKELMEKNTPASLKKVAKYCNVAPEQVKAFFDCISTAIANSDAELMPVVNAANALNPEDRTATMDDCMKVMKDMGGYTRVASTQMDGSTLTTFTRDLAVTGKVLLAQAKATHATQVAGVEFPASTPPPPPHPPPPPPPPPPPTKEASVRARALEKLSKDFDLESFDLNTLINRQRSTAMAEKGALAEALYDAVMVYRLFECEYGEGTGPETPYAVPTRIGHRVLNVVPEGSMDHQALRPLGNEIMRMVLDVKGSVLDAFPELFGTTLTCPSDPTSAVVCIEPGVTEQLAISKLCEAVDRAAIGACIYQLCMGLPSTLSEALGVLDSMNGNHDGDIWLRLHRMVGLVKWYNPAVDSKLCAPVHVLKQLCLSHLRHFKSAPSKRYVVRGLRRCMIDGSAGWLETLDADFDILDALVDTGRVARVTHTDPNPLPPPSAYHVFELVYTLTLQEDASGISCLLDSVSDECILDECEFPVKRRHDGLLASPTLRTLTAIRKIADIMLSWKSKRPAVDEQKASVCVMAVINRVVRALKAVSPRQREDAFTTIFFSSVAATHMLAPAWSETIANIKVLEVDGAPRYTFTITGMHHTSSRLWWWILVKAGAVHDALGVWIPDGLCGVMNQRGSIGSSILEPNAAMGRMLTHFGNFKATESLTWLMKTMPTDKADQFLFSGCATTQQEAPSSHAPFDAHNGDNPMRHHLIELLSLRTTHFEATPGTKTLEQCRKDQEEMEAWAKSKGLSPPITLCMPIGGGPATMVGGESDEAKTAVVECMERMLGPVVPLTDSNGKEWPDWMSYVPEKYHDMVGVDDKTLMAVAIKYIPPAHPFHAKAYAKAGIARAKRGKAAQAAAAVAASPSKQGWQEALRSSNMAVGGIVELADSVLAKYKTDGIRSPVLEMEALMAEVQETAVAGKAQIKKLEERLQSVAKIKLAWKQQDKHADREDKARREKEAADAKAQQERDGLVLKLANAIAHCPAQWEDVVASGYDEVLKKKLFDRVAKTLAASKPHADPADWNKLSQMRETWRTRLTVAKRAAKEIQAQSELPARIDVESDDGLATTDLSTEPSPVVESPPPPIASGSSSPPVSTLTKAEKRARKKQRETEATEAAAREAAEAKARKEAEAQAARVRAVEEEEAAVAAALAASLDTAEKEREWRERRRHNAVRLQQVRHVGLNGAETIIYTNQPPPQPAPPRRGDHIVPSAAAVAAAIRVPAPPPQVVVPLSAISAPSPQRPADAASTVATSLQCVVCMSSERSHVAVPCGHRVLCEGCATKAKIKACPLCRKPVQMWMMVFE